MSMSSVCREDDDDEDEDGVEHGNADGSSSSIEDGCRSVVSTRAGVQMGKHLSSSRQSSTTKMLVISSDE